MGPDGVTDAGEDDVGNDLGVGDLDETDGRVNAAVAEVDGPAVRSAMEAGEFSFFRPDGD